MAGKGEDILFACTCGKVSGMLLGVSPSSGTHAACYCSQCRCAELYKNQPDPVPGPVDLFQTTPDRVRFETGLQHLAVFSFSERGLLRWYADCCGSTLFNTTRSPRLAFASVRTDRLADRTPLGPVVARAFVPAKGGGTRHEGAGVFLLGTLRRILTARLTGRWRKTPFFDVEQGTPILPVHVMSAAECAALPLEPGRPKTA